MAKTLSPRRAAVTERTDAEGAPPQGSERSGRLAGTGEGVRYSSKRGRRPREAPRPCAETLKDCAFRPVGDLAW
eukprot:scaffold34_cov260-Pinguiococcus_pyrenoidosus.AAC.31